MERLLTPKEAAKIMAVSPRTIKEWGRRGELTGIKIRNLWRIRNSDLEKFIQQGNPEAISDEEPLYVVNTASKGQTGAITPLADSGGINREKLEDEC
ncbi:MAG TPA: helix-turn-helix domain-containing protein [Thermodesulfobacteriota bacterium]|nr:helix-turn-helix domain-containing protein [Thermodesulfobacteriota bacterium]